MQDLGSRVQVWFQTAVSSGKLVIWPGVIGNTQSDLDVTLEAFSDMDLMVEHLLNMATNGNGTFPKRKNTTVQKRLTVQVQVN